MSLKILNKDPKSREQKQTTPSKQTDMTPDSEAAKQFWESIWSIESTHHEDAEWLMKLKEEVEFPQQAYLSITIDTVTQLWCRGFG